MPRRRDPSQVGQTAREIQRVSGPAMNNLSAPSNPKRIQFEQKIALDRCQARLLTFSLHRRNGFNISLASTLPSVTWFYRGGVLPRRSFTEEEFYRGVLPRSFTEEFYRGVLPRSFTEFYWIFQGFGLVSKSRNAKESLVST